MQIQFILQGHLYYWSFARPDMIYVHLSHPSINIFHLETFERLEIGDVWDHVGGEGKFLAVDKQMKRTIHLELKFIKINYQNNFLQILYWFFKFLRFFSEFHQSLLQKYSIFVSSEAKINSSGLIALCNGCCNWNWKIVGSSPARL
jgi:hypothetical protein